MPVIGGMVETAYPTRSVEAIQPLEATVQVASGPIPTSTLTSAARRGGTTGDFLSAALPAGGVPAIVPSAMAGASGELLAEQQGGPMQQQQQQGFSGGTGLVGGGQQSESGMAGPHLIQTGMLQGTTYMEGQQQQPRQPEPEPQRLAQPPMGVAAAAGLGMGAVPVHDLPKASPDALIQQPDGNGSGADMNTTRSPPLYPPTPPGWRSPCCLQTTNAGLLPRRTRWVPCSIRRPGRSRRWRGAGRHARPAPRPAGTPSSSRRSTSARASASLTSARSAWWLRMVSPLATRAAHLRRIPPAAFPRCRAAEAGQGFAITRLSNGQWSAPAALKIRGGGFGITLGFNHVRQEASARPAVRSSSALLMPIDRRLQHHPFPDGAERRRGTHDRRVAT